LLYLKVIKIYVSIYVLIYVQPHQKLMCSSPAHAVSMVMGA